MGLSNSQPVFITGEVDFRNLRPERFLFFPRTKTNICLRYPQATFTRPSMIEVNYTPDLTVQYYQIPDRQPPVYCKDGEYLRSKNKTRIVLLEGTYNKLTGKISDVSVVDAKIVDITNN
jgi:hypothetical protein